MSVSPCGAEGAANTPGEGAWHPHLQEGQPGLPALCPPPLCFQALDLSQATLTPALSQSWTH